ncbi:DNA replication/repair protein RecF [Aquipuribacter hungaricus]|uniref:DNA replication and repair protein RecF n=1 Tax=Aquipuribacter hungaricus TaxID=545624 RepID=A0ABV7WHJ9_9MICO
MHVEHLSLTDFRSYPTAEVPLGPGVTTLVGDNGQGKTNVVEALAYLATLGSHRVATDAALVRSGAERAVVRGRLRRGGRAALLELEITPGRANRARVNRSPTRPREVLGLLRTVVFAPEDLAVVKGEPDQRRRFVDDLLVALSPRYAGVRSDYERVVRQRSALLKNARGLRGEARDGLMTTLEVWDGQLAQTGADLLSARLRTLEQLAPYAEQAYADVSGVPGALRTAYRARGLHPGVRSEATAGLPAPPTDRTELHDALLAAVAQARTAEIDRGTTLVGPHRDDVDLVVNGLPARGYASHGESWSTALALRVGSFDLLRDTGGDDGEPVLVLDDVFAELDARRRRHLAGRALAAEQVLVTAAVAEDVPPELAGRVLTVRRDPATGLSSITGPDVEPGDPAPDGSDAPDPALDGSAGPGGSV